MNRVDKNKVSKPIKYIKTFVIQINNLKPINKSIILSSVKQSKLNNLIFVESLIFIINLLTKIYVLFYTQYMIMVYIMLDIKYGYYLKGSKNNPRDVEV